MTLGTKSTSTEPPSKRHRPIGSRIARIIGIVGVLRAIALEYRTAIVAEETYRRLRFSCGSDDLHRDQQALVIKRLYCGYEQ